MHWFSSILTIFGLCIFEVVSSLDNAVVNADVLSTMSQKWRKWFLIWGIFFSVFLIRGLLPWFIVWMANPSLGPVTAFTASFSNDPHIEESLRKSSPILLMGGGIFLLFLFLHWLFLEPKEFGLPAEKFFARHGIWFFALSSILLTVIIWLAMQRDNMLAFAACVGSSAFFMTHGFKEHAAQAEREMVKGKAHLSDFSKLMYLEVLDATFSIDGVVGAFAFTMSIPLIIIGNGLGAIVVRELTIRGVDKIKNYPYLKNGAMYSILCLGVIMLLDSFGQHVPHFIAPIVTLSVIGFFFLKSVKSKKILHKAST